MAKRTTKRQQARELAMMALAERLANQEKVKAATQRAFLAQTELEAVRARFAAAVQELDQLGEAHTWLRESFGLTASELRQLLALDTDGIHDEDDDKEQLDGEQDTTTSDTTNNEEGEDNRDDQERDGQNSHAPDNS
ncbi:hypothetical protein PAB09_03535 [Corynebacterium sp. SCR221107]|uniref:hypothetical protein n=1 Tax=Corynebacterium sp. SCR221107 TaxID=3017361 RepID=UPI0022EC6C80|nr:hypothetical protein [Corynebacterium sp. SCR221107]WBT09411.1 hypothetical protein PAB09_03535 [Corynebacterium sp. SCR221107]